MKSNGHIDCQVNVHRIMHYSHIRHTVLCIRAYPDLNPVFTWGSSLKEIQKEVARLGTAIPWDFWAQTWDCGVATTAIFSSHWSLTSVLLYPGIVCSIIMFIKYSIYIPGSRCMLLKSPSFPLAFWSWIFPPPPPALDLISWNTCRDPCLLANRCFTRWQ